MSKMLNSILVVAPHLCLPARNGSDISLERVARHLSRHAEYVDLVSSQNIRRYRGAEVESETSFDNQLRSKIMAAVRTLLFRSHYYAEKFNTNAIQEVIHKVFESANYTVVLASYLTTLDLLPASRTRELRLVWTHNDEFKWYEDIARTARNPLTRMVSRQSYQWLKRQVPRLTKEAVFLHVSQADRQGFEHVVPQHRNLVVSVGTDIDIIPQWPVRGVDDPVILSFMGTLGVKMATDALNHFHVQFEPALRAALGAKLEIRIIGSQPAPAVIELCRTAGWKLFSDVAEADFVRLLQESTFTFLPFAYATGIKLKLIRSLGSGIPFLSTTASRPPNFPILAGSCFSDNPSDWIMTIQTWLANPDPSQARQQLLALAQTYSWPAVVADIVGQISTRIPA